MSKEKKHKKGLTAFGIIVLVLVLILAIIIGGTYWYINSKLSKIQKVDIDENDLNVSAQAEEQLADYRNIAIFGIDSREDTYDKGNRSDCIIIASINNKTKDVKLVSVYRDTYVQVEGHGLDKITHAYSYGEAPLAIKTLNTNLDLNIKEFVTVNFDAVKEIIDDIGGISMNITAEEVPHISGITKAGTYNLTGEQALAYARIRYATGGDYKRTERMRDVLTAVVNKVKTFNISQLNILVDQVLPRVYTNITANDIFGLLPSAPNFKIVESLGWPYDTKGKTMDRWYGIPITLESNVTRLHQEVFEQKDYSPSDTVKNISNQNYKLLILGSALNELKTKTKYQEEIENIVQTISSKVIFTGFIKYEEINKFYSIADIAVLPSIWDDPAPLTVIESLVSGLPIITTNSGGIPEYATNGSAIIIERNKDLVENLSKSINLLLNDEAKLKEMSISAKKVSKDLTLNNYYNNFIDIMKKG